jgi:RHS repeat-associated protein
LYDALNRVTNVIDNRLTGTKNTGYAFDGVGNLQSLSYPNGLTNLWQYDPLNRLTNLTWKLSGAQRGDFAYQLGTAGNRTNLVDNVNGTSRTFSWSYDNLYRLTNETISGGSPTGTLGYGYDDVANRTSRTGTIGSLTASNNTFDVNDWISGLVFDANGNTRTNGSIYYGYDWANRLTSQTNGSAVVTMVYDADGNRIQKVTTTATTLYLVATVNPSGNPQVVEEFTVSGGVTNLSKVYSYGLQLISQRQVSSGTVNFYGYDGHGSTRFLTSTNGTITDTYTYDAYGTLIASTGSTANNYLYCGEQWDPDVGLYYLRARYYLPTLGRFWTMDSFEGRNRDPLSLHKYVFVEDNPVNKIDPTGLDGDEISLLATINTMVRVAATYVSRMPVAARAAFAAGGSTLGAFFNRIGAQVEQWGAEVIEMFPSIERVKPVLEGFTRRPDWLLRVGNTLRVVEGKYQLPSAGPALTRIGSQIQQYSQWASQGAGREVVVWALKSPQNAATAEQTVLQAAGNPQGVRFVYGVKGLFDYLTQWVN